MNAITSIPPTAAPTMVPVEVLEGWFDPLEELELPEEEGDEVGIECDV